MKYEDDIIITIGKEQFESIMLGFGQMMGSFTEVNTISVDNVTFDGEFVEIKGGLYSEEMN